MNVKRHTAPLLFPNGANRVAVPLCALRANLEGQRRQPLLRIDRALREGLVRGVAHHRRLQSRLHQKAHPESTTTNCTCHIQWSCRHCGLECVAVDPSDVVGGHIEVAGSVDAAGCGRRQPRRPIKQRNGAVPSALGV